MNTLYSSALITAVFGFLLLIFGAVHGKRTGKIEFYVLAIIGLCFIVLGLSSVQKLNRMEKTTPAKVVLEQTK